MKKQRVIALVGIGRGPTVSVREFTAPAVRVMQLQEGEEVLVGGFPDESHHVIDRNGDHPLNLGDTTFLEHRGSSRSLLCFIVET